MVDKREKQAPYGSPQFNLRIEKDLLDEIESEAEKQGISRAQWAITAFKSALGKEIATTVPRSEFEQLKEEVEELKKFSLVA